MSTLTTKLTLAFLLVGIIGAVLVAVLVGEQTRSGFERFRSERDQATLVATLGEYYADTGSWDGVEAMLAGTPALDSLSRRVAIVNANGVVVRGNRNHPRGERVAADAAHIGAPITANGQVVGYLLFDQLRPLEPGPGDRPPPEVAFLQRVTWAAATSAGVAALLALLLGLLLARTLTGPIRELTRATRAMALGELDQRVAVRSQDEIGELAHSFNQMSADLARGSRLRKQMTADLAHDLRTPLSILRGYTEGLRDERLQGTSQLYAIMHGEVEHLQRLVEDLRVLSLADAGELPLNIRVVDPAALLERTGLAYIVQAEQHGVQLRVEAAGDLPSVAVDTDRMAQVLSNLVSNALRHTHQGEIVLSASADAGQVRLRVRDTGEGIAPEDVPLVFDRFYRADKARQRVESTASGLGLAIAKAIVEALGGTIGVESAPGAGTTFTVSLPIASQHSARAARHEPRTAHV
jgi:two-component system sensor histidine kinase BaeS